VQDSAVSERQVPHIRNLADARIPPDKPAVSPGDTRQRDFFPMKCYEVVLYFGFRVIESLPWNTTQDRESPSNLRIPAKPVPLLRLRFLSEKTCKIRVTMDFRYCCKSSPTTDS